MLASNRILVLEDDREVRPLLERELIGAGYSVTAVATAATALMLLARNPYDLLLTDGKLSNETGMDVAEEASRQGAAVLILTRYSLPLPPQRLRQIEYLAKPVRPSKLIKAVERSLQRKGRDARAVPFPRPGSQ